MREKRLLLFVFFMLFLFALKNLKSDTISLVIENDFFAGTDKHYTNGLRVGWLREPIKGDTFNGESDNFEKKIIKTWFKLIPFSSLKKDMSYNIGVSLYQMMFTPEDITKKEPNYNDIPYAGHLLFSFFLFEHNVNSYNEYKVQFGIVGPASGAGDAQRWFHDLIGGVHPEGWETQLGNYPTFGIAFDHGLRKWEKNFKGGFSSELIGNFGFSAGNFFTGASFGANWRFGKNYPKNFNVYYSGVVSEAALLGLQQLPEKFGWSVNFGLFLDIIAYLYILDAHPEYKVDRGYFLGRAVISLSFYFKRFQLSVTKQIRTSILTDKKNNLAFGSVSLLWRF